jgi:hypothetical protein
MQRVVQFDDPEYQMQLNRTVSDFETRHRGGQAIEIQGVIVYPDGARRTRGILGEHREPPSDQYELWTLLVLYRQEAYTRVAAAQAELGHVLAIQASKAYAAMSSDIPGDHEIEQLRKLTIRRQKAQRSLKIAKQQLKRHTPAHVKEEEKHQQELIAENQEYAERAMEKIQKLGFRQPTERVRG